MHMFGTPRAIATRMLQRYLIVLLSSFALFACGSNTGEGFDDESYDVTLQPGASTQIQVSVDAATQFSLESDASNLNTTIKVTKTSPDGPVYESEWTGTPFVDVMEQGAYTIEITNDSPDPVIGSLYQTLL